MYSFIGVFKCFNRTNGNKSHKRSQIKTCHKMFRKSLGINKGSGNIDQGSIKNTG